MMGKEITMFDIHDNENVNVYNTGVEQYRKRRGGKMYRCVRFFVDGYTIEIADIKTDSDEAALQKAKKLLAKVMKYDCE